MRFLLVGFLLVTATACASEPGPVPEVDAEELAGAMCEAADAARGGDLGRARELFEDNHAGLHALADGLADTDRQRAGELLRAKQEVESVLRRAPADRLATLLDELAQATADDPTTCG